MKKALILLSGGQDSTTCLAWAKNKFDDIISITFNYGQKNFIEIEQAKKLSEIFKVKNIIFEMSFFSSINNSALTNHSLEINTKTQIKKIDLTASYVPNRNAIFLSTAHAYAQNENIENIIIGTTKNDVREYPDSDKKFLYSLNNLLNLSSNTRIKLHTPLIDLSKVEIFKLAKKEDILDLIIELSHTCYKNIRTKKYSWGYGCGECTSCIIREKAWKEFIKKPK